MFLLHSTISVLFIYIKRKYETEGVKGGFFSVLRAYIMKNKTQIAKDSV